MNSFHNSAETVPVETQLLLLEIDRPASSSSFPTSFTTYSLPLPKMYALLAPLINFEKGFRSTVS